MYHLRKLREAWRYAENKKEKAIAKEKIHHLLRISSLLLEKGAFPLSTDRGSVIHYAIESGTLEAVKQLVEIGKVDVDLSLEDAQSTLLHYAIEKARPTNWYPGQFFSRWGNRRQQAITASPKRFEIVRRYIYIYKPHTCPRSSSFLSPGNIRSDIC